MISCDTDKLIAEFRIFILDRDLTLRQVALILKMSHSAVSDIINKKTVNPHPRTIHKIKKLIGE